MVKQRVDTGGEVFGPYSPGVKANGIIWLAGQIAPEAGGIREQTQAKPRQNRCSIGCCRRN